MAFNIERINANIRYLMKINNKSSVSALAKDLGVQQPTLQRMLSGEVKNPRYSTLECIAEYFQISPVQLIEEDLRQPVALTEENLTEIKVTEKKPTGWRLKWVPVAGDTETGILIDRGNHKLGHIRWPSSSQATFAIKCVGETGAPRYQNGVFIIVEPDYAYQPGDDVIIITKQNTVLLHTFMFENTNCYHLLPFHEDQSAIRIEKKDVVQLNYIVGMAKSHLWHP